MKRTIPEIAEELRSHINNDNDAPRLIAEHVLPLLGIELTLKDLKLLEGDNDDLRTTLKDTAEELTDAISDMDDESYETAKGRLRDFLTRLRNS